MGKTAIDRDLENAAAPLAQGYVRAWVLLFDDLLRLTGAWLVASTAAVFDLDTHFCLLAD